MRLTFKKLALLGAHLARGVAKIADLTSARLDFVTLLMHGPLCQRDIAARLCVSEAVISRMVRGLMKQGFVKREIPVADKRFRLVSLTTHGRHEYTSITHVDWLMPPNARVDAQGSGEMAWLEDWRRPIEHLGLGYLVRLGASDTTEKPPAEPPYDGMRERHRIGFYRDSLDIPGAPMATSWPWDVRVLAPPLERGLENDPLSDAYAAAWERAQRERRPPPPTPRARWGSLRRLHPEVP